MKVTIEVSPAELIDKITILEIKTERIHDEDALNHIQSELNMLRDLFDRHIPRSEPLEEFTKKLKNINHMLWEIEDDIRQCERLKDFGDRFIELARSVYKTNDQRATLKQQINQLLSSAIQEVKSYTPYS